MINTELQNNIQSKAVTPKRKKSNLWDMLNHDMQIWWIKPYEFMQFKFWIEIFRNLKHHFTCIKIQVEDKTQSDQSHVFLEVFRM